MKHLLCKILCLLVFTTTALAQDNPEYWTFQGNPLRIVGPNDLGRMAVGAGSTTSPSHGGYFEAWANDAQGDGAPHKGRVALIAGTNIKSGVMLLANYNPIGFIDLTPGQFGWVTITQGTLRLGDGVNMIEQFDHVAAQGNNQATARLAFNSRTVITSATAGVDDSLRLPPRFAGELGTKFHFYNRTNVVIQIFPAPNASIELHGVDQPVLLQPYSNLHLINDTPGTWILDY